MASAGERTTAEQLILARLLVPAKKPPSRGEVQKHLAPFFEHRRTAAEWNALFEGALDGLVAAGEVSPRPLQLTDTGREKALAFVGLSEVPPRLNWATLRDTWLVARALGAPTDSAKDRQRLKSAEGLRAFVLKSHYELPLAGCPTLKQSIDALTWKQLGIETDRPLTLAAVIEELLGRLLDLPGKLKKDQLQKQLPAKLLKASKTDAADLRLAAIRSWLDTRQAEPVAASPEPAEPLDLTAFARRVTDAARHCPGGWFGESKVFIGHVWRQVQNDRMLQPMDEVRFKELLVKAHRAGLLALSRADLVEAMDPDDVAASATSFLNAVFHFVQVPRADAPRPAATTGGTERQVFTG